MRLALTVLILIRLGMNAEGCSKGDSYDNAAAEAVNSLYKRELINREGPWQGAGDVTVATAGWVDWYNNNRLHSACGNVPPSEYENTWIMGHGQATIIPEAQASWPPTNPGHLNWSRSSRNIPAVRAAAGA
jgi:Integrase core domain